MKKIKDANGNSTVYAFDNFDRAYTTTYADNKFSQFDYDKNSNMIRHTTPSTKTIEYDYDALNRLTSKRYPQQTAFLDSTYGYDLASRMTSANNSAAEIAFTYDNLNQVKTTTQILSSMPYALSYQYDKTGNRTQVIYHTGKIVDFSYDELNRLNEVKVNTKRMTEYTYDPLNRRIQKEYRIEDEDAPRRTGPVMPTPANPRFKDVIEENIKPGIPFQGTIQRTSYSWDMGNQLNDLTNQVVGGDVISRYQYPAYDNVGNRKQMIAPDGVHDYGYNTIYELTEEKIDTVPVHSYDYDNAANREVADGTIYQANNLNQYTNVGETTFTYDGNGNLTSDGINTYTYDEENRLTSVICPLSSAQYTYDAFNRRVSKTVDGVTTYFINNGDQEIAEYDSGGNLEAEYVYGSGIDEVLTMSRNDQTYYYHTDGLGSVSEITDANGDVVESYEYDPYGDPTIYDISHTPLAISQINNPYMFTGRRFDEESGIYHYRARMYDPNIGRFLQRDPVQYYDSMNLYSYVNNNSTNYVDPSGEILILPLLAIAWAVTEVALSAYDAYTTGKTLLDPCASGLEKSATAGLFFLGMLAPGGGYATAGKTVTKKFTTVIGHLEDTQVAKNWPGHNVLDIPNWTWGKNVKWLDDAIERGDEIYIASKEIRVDSIAAREIKYLEEHGYTRIGNYMIKN